MVNIPPIKMVIRGMVNDCFTHYISIKTLILNKPMWGAVIIIGENINRIVLEGAY